MGRWYWSNIEHDEVWVDESDVMDLPDFAVCDVCGCGTNSFVEAGDGEVFCTDCY